MMVSPSGCKWKFEELTSNLPLLPLKNCAEPPKKKVSAFMSRTGEEPIFILIKLSASALNKTSPPPST